MKRIPGEKLTEQNNRKISHFWKEKKKSGERGQKYFKQECQTVSANAKRQVANLRGKLGFKKRNNTVGHI